MSDLTLPIQETVDKFLPEDEGVRVLEAGCGSFTHLRGSPSWHVVGIDISRRQLDRNPALAERILGDIQTFPLPANSFDMIVSWWVLEHLSDPSRALRNFVAALRPGGLVVLAFPNVLSVKGLVTKLAPHWFHVWVYRRLLGKADAGRDDQAPFPTYLRFSIRPNGIRRFASSYGLSVEVLKTYEAPYQAAWRRRFGPLNACWSVVRALLHVASLGAMDINQTEVLCVLRKPPLAAEAVRRSANDDGVGKVVASSTASI